MGESTRILRDKLNIVELNSNQDGVWIHTVEFNPIGETRTKTILERFIHRRKKS